jgi:hypothetical protein
VQRDENRLIIEINKKLTGWKISKSGEKIVATAGSPGSDAVKTDRMMMETL